MEINLMGNVVPNDAEIESGMQDYINSIYPPSKREKVLRTGVGKDALDAFFTDMSSMKAQIVADRDLLSATIRYEQAESRLAVAILDANAVNEDGSPMYPLDENGVNAVIEQDLAERAEAQAVIDGASAEVVALVVTRKGASI